MQGNKPELLAPAGNAECLRAAVSAGADAVYLGLNEFNARRNADNFTLETLGDACNYAHLRGVSVYVTMNVEILPSELERAMQVVRGIFEAGADAIIVQDVGLAAEVKRVLPSANLHVSTQMNIHNAAGIELAARLGASRVTLARELALEEVSELAAFAADYGMEVEVFAHGALCVCYSGQCLMSSMIGGRSANRGLCAQACRLPYELRRADIEEALPSPGDHLLSPRDLCTVDMLGDFAAAGVASLKVEGRMKSADYVHEVVSVYREALDAGMVTDEHRARLAEAFSRGFTTAYLHSRRGNDIMSYGRPNNRGVFVGRVARAADGVAEIVPEVELHEGDVLEFWTNRGHFAVTLADVRMRGGATVGVPVEQRVGKGDRVFRVRNAATAFRDDPFEPRVSVRGEVVLRMGAPARVSFSAAGAFGEALGKVVEPARTRAVDEAGVRDHVDRLGQTPFRLCELDIQLDDGVGIGFSELHHLRADALNVLAKNILVSWRDRIPAGKTFSRGERAAAQANGEGAAAQAHPLSRGENASAKSLSRGENACEVVAWVTSPSTARAAKRAGADAMYVPLLNFKRGQSAVEGVRQDVAEQAGYPKQCVMALPAIDHDPVAGTREYGSAFDMWDYIREGKRVFADSLAGAIRALDMGAVVEIGPHVPVTNAASLRFLADLGVSRVWLSPELTLGQIADLAACSPIPLGLVVGGAQELMITEHCLLMSQGACAQMCETCDRRAVAHRLVDRKGFEFPVITDMLGRSHLYNGIQLDAVSAMPDLLDIGISAVMVDVTLMGRKATSDAVGRALRAREAAAGERRSLPKRPGTTTGHLYRGVS